MDVAPVVDVVVGPDIAEQSVVEGENMEDCIWMDELDVDSIADVGVEKCDFGFGNDEVCNAASSAAGSIDSDTGSIATATGSIVSAGDVALASTGDQEILDVAGLRPLPHPELVKVGKGKEKSPSAHNDSWALKRVDQLRKSMGWDMRIHFGDLPLDQINDLLSNLFARAVKVSGEEYPASTLMNMLGGFNRIIRRQSALRLLNKRDSYVVEKDFNIKKHIQFTKTRMVLEAAIKKTAREGTNKKTKKVEIITEAMEEAIFADLDFQITENEGCQKLLALLLMLRCGVRGGKELWNLQRKDVSIEADARGQEYVRFEERLSKNNSWNLDRYKEHQFRKVYHSFEPRFVMCVKQYLRHMPPLDLLVPDLLLQPITGPATIIWYNRVQKVGRDKCGGYLKNATLLVGIDPDVFTNKSGRATLITRMAARGVPDEVGMLVSGHHTTDGYLRYDRSQPLKMEAAILVGSNPDISYQDALAQVSKEFVDEKVVGISSQLHPLIAPSSSVTATSSCVTGGSISTAMVVAGNSSIAGSSSDSSTLAERVKGKAIAVSMVNEVVKGGGKTMVKITDSPQQITAWHHDYDKIDWEEEIRTNPALQKALGGICGAASQVSVGSRVGSSLAENNFTLGSYCVINFICNKKDLEDDKENEPSN